MAIRTQIIVEEEIFSRRRRAARKDKKVGPSKGGWQPLVCPPFRNNFPLNSLTLGLFLVYRGVIYFLRATFDDVGVRLIMQ